MNADEEALYKRGATLVLEHQKASTSWLQRQLRIGYNSAARIIERMEADGYVSRPDHIGRREVLQPPSMTLPIYEGAAEPNPWDRNAGRFDQPSTSSPDAEVQNDPGQLENLRKVEPLLTASEEGESAPLVQVAVDLVQSLGLEGARRAVRAAAEAAGEAEKLREPKAKSDHLRAIVERTENLFAERDAIRAEIADVLKFAKDIGLDPAAIRRVIKDRSTDRDKRYTAEAIYTVYRHALGIEDPDFAVELPAPTVPPPVKARKLTAKEKAYQETLASVAASRVVLLQ